MLDAEYEKISLKTIMTSLNYLKDKMNIPFLNYFRKIKKCSMESLINIQVLIIL